MKKKLLAILMCAVLALSMVACGGKEEPAAEAPAATEEAATEEAAAPAESQDLPYTSIYLYRKHQFKFLSLEVDFAGCPILFCCFRFLLVEKN